MSHVLITGGGTGVGAAIAQTFAASGAEVTITGRREAPLRDVTGPRIGWAVADVTDAGAMRAAVAEASEKRGPITVAVANAGAGISKPFADLTTADMTAALSVNLIGVMNTWQAVLPAMKEANAGRLIAIASTAGLKGYAFVSAYVAAKHGVVGLTRAVALELARTGITVNSVCPGFTETAMLDDAIDNVMRVTGRSRDEAAKTLSAGNPQRRFVQPAEVADAVLWLAGKNASAITGQAIPVAGGEI